MQKYIIQPKDGISILKVDCEKISILEDPSIMWLPNGESKYRILSLKEKDGNHPVWHSYAIFDNLEAAKSKCIQIIKDSFEFDLRKYNIAYTEAQVVAAINEIKF